MSQAATWSIPTTGPATPTAFATRANDSYNALLSAHSGTARPSYAVAGTLWYNTSNSTLFLFNGTTDLAVYPDANNSIALAKLATTGTANSTTFLRGDGAWTAIAGVSFATAADYRSNTAGSIALSPAVVWSAAAEVALTFGATITPDMNTFLNAAFTATSAFTLANPTNAKAGQSGYIRIAQDATGGRTISFGTAYDFPAGMSKALSTPANSIDVLFYTVRSSTEIFCTLQKGFA